MLGWILLAAGVVVVAALVAWAVAWVLARRD